VSVVTVSFTRLPPSGYVDTVHHTSIVDSVH
jgi:hypothetical protein